MKPSQCVWVCLAGLLWWAVVVGTVLLFGGSEQAAAGVALVLGPIGGAFIGWQIGARI
jgi:hypothetical protein